MTTTVCRHKIQWIIVVVIMIFMMNHYVSKGYLLITTKTRVWSRSIMREEYFTITISNVDVTHAMFLCHAASPR